MEETEIPSKLIVKMVIYLIDENFPVRHLQVLAKIIGLFNDCAEAEQEIFDFAQKLFDKYAGPSGR